MKYFLRGWEGGSSCGRGGLRVTAWAGAAGESFEAECRAGEAGLGWAGLGWAGLTGDARYHPTAECPVSTVRCHVSLSSEEEYPDGTE